MAMVIGVLMVVGTLAGAPPAGPIVSAVGGVVRPGVRGIAMGLFYTMFYLGMVIIPALGGLVIDLSGSLASGILLIPVLLLLSLMFFSAFYRRRVRHLRHLQSAGAAD